MPRRRDQEEIGPAESTSLSLYLLPIYLFNRHNRQSCCDTAIPDLDFRLAKFVDPDKPEASIFLLQVLEGLVVHFVRGVEFMAYQNTDGNADGSIAIGVNSLTHAADEKRCQAFKVWVF